MPYDRKDPQAGAKTQTTNRRKKITSKRQPNDKKRKG